jgi:DNA invertase Pin-like site-specific DNA recombinase
MTDPRKVAIYARVSTAEQEPGVQLVALRDYAVRRGFTIYKEYVDRVTGDVAKRHTRRKPSELAYQELMHDVNRRAVDCVLVWKYDRFARSLSVLVSALQHFHTLGVDFISYTQDIDTTTPMGRLFFHIIASFAEFERAVIAERVRAGLAHAKAQGKVLGRPERTPGARARIVALRQQGLSLRAIAQREGYSPAGVWQILRRTHAPGEHGHAACQRYRVPPPEGPSDIP